jgi:hypothetical protein
MPAPLITHEYMADPSAHYFDGRVYVYPSHDRATDIKFNDKGDQYDMVDYHVLSMDSIGAPVTDHGAVLRVEDVPWASKQLWAPDAARGKDGRYHLYFPARDKEGESIVSGLHCSARPVPLPFPFPDHCISSSQS